MGVELIPFGKMHEPRGQQVDVRFTKNFRLVGSTRLRGNFDVFNVFNANDILSMVGDYGSQWLNASQILSGRLMKFSVAFDF